MSMTDGMTEQQQAALKRDLAVIGELLALPFVKKHDTRFANEVALVAPAANLKEVDAVVERFLPPPPTKPAGEKTPLTLIESPLFEAMGGVRGDQTLYLKVLGDGISVYVAYWPWGGGQRVTIKVGIHIQPA
jgi:hypothetical protein